MEHQAGKCHHMQAGNRFGQACIVAGQVSEPAGPGTAALDDPPPGQHHEAPLSLGQPRVCLQTYSYSRIVAIVTIAMILSSFSERIAIRR